MSRDATAESHRTLAVVPPIRATAPWRVASVEAIGHGRLRVTFVDGTAGMVDLRALLASDGIERTVFAPLRDTEEFQRVSVTLGAVTWPCGADLAPDAMHEIIRERGEWVVA